LEENDSNFFDENFINSSYYDEEIYEKYKQNNKPIFRHHKKYINDKYAPAWKTIEFFTFGSSLKLFRALKDESIKTIIASSYSLRSLAVFENFIQSVVYVRNMCSHGGVLYDLSQPKGINKIPENKYIFNNRHSLDASIKVIIYLLEQISKNRSIELKSKLNILFSKYKNNQIIKNIIETKIGYTM
jgi:abortive infection bacteriophage resistance protein